MRWAILAICPLAFGEASMIRELVMLYALLQNLVLAVGREGFGDKMVWKPTKNDNFSFKSLYCFLGLRWLESFPAMTVYDPMAVSKVIYFC